MRNICEFVNTGVEFVSLFCQCLTLEFGTDRQCRNFGNWQSTFQRGKT